MAWRNFELVDEKSAKFWNIRVIRNTYTVHYGRIGSDGQQRTTECADVATAREKRNRLIQQKLDKGYVEVAVSRKQKPAPAKARQRQSRPKQPSAKRPVRRASALVRLRQRIDPPAKPKATGSIALRKQIERELGTVLPDDLFEFAQCYGTGEFAAPSYSNIVTVFNPYSPRYIRDVNSWTGIFREQKEVEGDEYIPFRIFPDAPGLLAWGWGENRRSYFWLTRGKPNNWPIVLLTPEETFQQFECGMTDFLARLFEGSVNAGGSWDADWFTSNRDKFEFR